MPTSLHPASLTNKREVLLACEVGVGRIAMCVLCQQLDIRERGVVVHTGALAESD